LVAELEVEPFGARPGAHQHAARLGLELGQRVVPVVPAQGAGERDRGAAQLAHPARDQLDGGKVLAEHHDAVG
jgi:hypothetical protein